MADLYSDPPLVHGGGIRVFALQAEPLTYIWDTVRPGISTVETGCGASTVAFAARGARHVCITPSDTEVALLKDYCRRKSVSLDTVEFIISPSEQVVHALPQTDFEFALIDGGHGFPIPFVDWLYIAARMRTGGRVMVDDTHLWTGQVLARFLDMEPGWEREAMFVRTAVFRMTEPYSYREWRQQPFVNRASRGPTRRYQIARAFELIGKGEFAALKSAVSKYLAERR